MKIENILKSAMLVGVLAGVSDMNPAFGKDMKFLGKDIHCPDVTVENKSESPTYDIQVLYRECGFPDRQETAVVKPGETSPVLSTHPEKEVRVDQRTGAPYGTPNLWNSPEVSQDQKIKCKGTAKDAACAPVEEPAVNKSSKK